MSELFALIDPTKITDEDDIRVTTYDLYLMVKALGGTHNHHDILDIAKRVFGTEVIPYRQLVNTRTGQEVDAGVLDKDMATTVAGKLGGDAGDRIARFLREKLRELRVIIKEQQKIIHAQALTLQEAKLKADAAYVIDGFPSQVLRDANRLYDDARLLLRNRSAMKGCSAEVKHHLERCANRYDEHALEKMRENMVESVGCKAPERSAATVHHEPVPGGIQLEVPKVVTNRTHI